MSKRVLGCWKYGAWIGLLVLSVDVGGLDAQETDPVASGKSALRSTRAPWYDVEGDGVRVVSLKKESTTGDRQDWQGDGLRRPDWKWEWDWDWWNWGSGSGGGGSFRLPSFGEVIQFLGWLLLFVLLSVLVYVLVKSFLDLEASQQALSRGPAEDEAERTDEQRIRDLPVQPQKRQGDFLSLARECYQTEQYAEAIVYLFSHRLMQLDRAGYIRLTRGKTNRQYLQETSRSEPVRDILGRTIVCFEDVFFGKHNLSRERFEQTWHDNDAFDRIVQDSLARS